MKDTKQLTDNQAEHIAALRAKVDIMEHGVIHASLPFIVALNDAMNDGKLTIERLREGVDKFNSLFNCLDKEQQELDSMFDYYVKKNSETEGAKHDNHE